MFKGLVTGWGPVEGDGRVIEVRQGSSQGGKVPTEASVETGHPKEPLECIPGGRGRVGQYDLHIGLLGTSCAVPYHMSQINHRGPP